MEDKSCTDHVAKIKSSERPLPVWKILGRNQTKGLLFLAKEGGRDLPFDQKRPRVIMARKVHKLVVCP